MIDSELLQAVVRTVCDAQVRLLSEKSCRASILAGR